MNKQIIKLFSGVNTFDEKGLAITYFCYERFRCHGNMLRFVAYPSNVHLNWGHPSGKMESWTSVSHPALG